MTGFHLGIRPWTSAAMLAVYDDQATFRHALAFERALAAAQAKAGFIAQQSADRIAEACDSLSIDPAELAEQAALAGTLAIPLVAALRAAIDDPEAAAAVHRDTTSQDLADTVMMLQARDAARLVDADLARIARALAALARAHADTPAVGRTLLQDAAPVAFGLRIAQWLAAVVDARRRLGACCRDALQLQLGGAAGTASGQGNVANEVAGALGLGVPVAPWHARRGQVAALGAALAIASGTLGKIGRDIALLAQNAIGELREPAIAGRGGSSAMPHKRNPTGSQVAISAAIRAPGLAATILSALPQELERGIGGWQVEAPVLAELFMLVGGSASAMADVAEGLEVDEAAIARNLDQSGFGSDTGDSRRIVDALLDQYGETD